MLRDSQVLVIFAANGFATRSVCLVSVIDGIHHNEIIETLHISTTLHSTQLTSA